MTFDDLQQQWQQSNASAADSPTNPDIVLRTVRRVEKSNSGIFRRDLIESAAAIFVIYFFGKGILTLPNWIAQSGSILIICGALFIMYKLHRARKVKGEAQPELSIREYYELEIERLRKQIDLLQNINSWYTAPCLIGANLVFAGIMYSVFALSSYFWIFSAIYLIITLLLGWWIYSVNQRGVKKHFVPLYEELKSQQKELDEPNITEPETNT